MENEEGTEVENTEATPDTETNAEENKATKGDTVPVERLVEVSRTNQQLRAAVEAEKAAREAAEAKLGELETAAKEIANLKEQLGFARAGIVEAEHQTIARALFESHKASKPDEDISLSDWVASKPDTLMRYLQPPASAETPAPSSSTGEAVDAGGSIRTQSRSASLPPPNTNSPFDSLKAARAAFEAAQKRGKSEEIESARAQLTEQFRSLGLTG